MMNRPIVLLAASYICGIVAGYYFITLNGFSVSAMAVIPLIAAYTLYRKTDRRMWFIVLPFFAVGAVLVNMQKAPGLFEAVNGESVTVGGIVTDIRITDYGRQIITVKASEITFDGNTIKYNKKISVKTDEPQKVLYGQSVTVNGTAEELNFRRNPGGYQENLYMRARGFGGKLSAETIETGEMRRAAVYFIRKAADNISTSFNKSLPEDMAGLMSAMILGDGAGVSGEISESFRKTGVSHILAISGLHLSIIAIIVFELLLFIGLRINGSAASTVIAMWVYCFFTGASVSTVRSALMITLLMVGYIFKRGADTYSALSLAAFIILLRQPLFLWDAGFLLSFSAVLGICFLTPLIRLKLPPLDTGFVKISGYMAATISATLFTMPVCAYFFSAVSLAGLLVNILIVPFAALLVGTGFAFMFFNALFVSDILASVIFTILKYFMVITQFFASLPFSYVTIGQPKLYNIALYYIIVILTALYINMKDEKPARVLRYTAECAVIMLLALNSYKLFPGNKMEIVFLDVGQGDASVLHLSGKVDIMIDGGGNILTEIGENTGIRTVIPYLEYKGKTKLDAIFLTHADLDHAAGVIEVMDNFKVGRLFISDVEINDEVLELVLQTAGKRGVPVSRIKNGYAAEINNVRIECVYPDYSGAPKNINNSSLVLKITHGENTFLFTGDIEKNDEHKILLSEAYINSDVLKVPHHGSKTSSSAEFVEAVSPEYAIVGTAKSNSFAHPSPEVVKVYADKGVKLYNTAVEGAVILKSDGKTIEIRTMREEQKFGRAEARY